MRLQNYGRLVKVEHFPEQSQSSRVLIKSSDVEVTCNVLRSLEKSDTKQNTNPQIEKNKATISTQRNRILTTESEEIEEIRNKKSVESYSFNAKNNIYNTYQKDSIGQTYGSVDESEDYQTNGGGRGFSKIEYNLRVESLARQYELKVRKQKELHEIQLWKMSEQINDLRKTVEKVKLKDKVQKVQVKEEYCYLCSNGEMISSLSKLNKQLQQTHQHCISNQNQNGIRMLQLQQQFLRNKQRLESSNKQNMSANEKIESLEKLNKSLIEQLRQAQSKLATAAQDLIKQKQKQQERQREMKKQYQESLKEKSQMQKPKQKLQRLSYNDISILQSQNTGSLGLPSNSKSIGNICNIANQYRRQTASYMSAMKKQTDADNLVERVKSLSSFNYRPMVERKQRRYY